MKWLIALLLCPGVAIAQQLNDWPTLYDVTGVSADDSLNVRVSPDAASSVLGVLDHNAKSVEVIRTSEDGKWARVNVGESSGWTSLRFLETSAPRQADRPAPVVCFGTEPFWAFTDRVPNQVKFQFPDADPLFFDISSEGASQNQRGRYFLVGANSETDLGSILRAEICSDGMSEREFGMSIDIGLIGDSGTTFLSGCCSVAP